MIHLFWEIFGKYSENVYLALQNPRKSSKSGQKSSENYRKNKSWNCVYEFDHQIQLVVHYERQQNCIRVMAKKQLYKKYSSKARSTGL